MGTTRAVDAPRASDRGRMTDGQYVQVGTFGVDANARAGFDYVLIGRAPTLDRPFADLHKHLTSALKRLHHSRSPSAGKDAP